MEQFLTAFVNCPSTTPGASDPTIESSLSSQDFCRGHTQTHRLAPLHSFPQLAQRGALSQLTNLRQQIF